MRLDRLGWGERLAGASALGLFVLMFFDWFTIKAVNTSNLLFAIASVESGKNAWEALGFIPIVLATAIAAALCVVFFRILDVYRESAFWPNAIVALLGLVSGILILYRIVSPPVFDTESTITYEGAVQLPMILSLTAAFVMAVGGALAARPLEVLSGVEERVP